MTRLLAAALAVSATLLAACRAVPLASDPLTTSPSRPPRQVFTVEWWRQLNAERELLETGLSEVAAPVYDPESRQVFALTRDGVVHALGLDGQPRWRHETGAPFSAGATVHEGKLLVPGGDGTLYALDVLKGTPLWSYATGEELASAPVVVDGKVLVTSHNSALYAVEAATGKWLWQYRRETPSGFTIRGVSQPTVGEGTAYIGFADGVVAALDLEDGSARWERLLSGPGGSFPDVDTRPVLADGRLYVASYKDGLYALEPSSGKVLWNTPTRGITDLVGRGAVLFATGDGQVSAFLAENGKQVWTLPLGKQAGRDLTLTGGQLLVSVQDALLFVDPGAGRELLRWDPGQGVSAAAVPGAGRLFVLSNLGYLYALDLAGGQG